MSYLLSKLRLNENNTDISLNELYWTKLHENVLNPVD